MADHLIAFSCRPPNKRRLVRQSPPQRSRQSRGRPVDEAGPPLSLSPTNQTFPTVTQGCGFDEGAPRGGGGLVGTPPPRRSGACGARLPHPPCPPCPVMPSSPGCPQAPPAGLIKNRNQSNRSPPSSTNAHQIARIPEFMRCHQPSVWVLLL